MNTIQILRHGLAYFCFGLASLMVLSLVTFLLRRQLRVLFDRWRALGRIGQCVTLVFVTGFVLYGGSKNIPPTRTNEQQNAYGPLITNLPQMEQLLETAALEASTRGVVRSATTQPSQQAQISQSSQQLSRWHARGAWEDWQRIEFPAGFAFPIGTNLIYGVTLMSQGALRTSLTNATPLVALPQRVSLEPGESSVAYGLTASNSFVIAWQNACVERDATNRVDASIELFDSGDILITVQPLTTNHQPPTTIFTPTPLPEGWTGEGIDGAWATNAFPTMVSNIVEVGYESWLTDYVGINEQNGRYKVTITIDELPESGPCYLECGPYKVVVKSTGSYSFPLDVLQHYTARTYPTAVPLTIEYDDGYRGQGTQQQQQMAAAPALRASVPWTPYIYDVCMDPCFYIYPSSVALDEAKGTHISVWCNITNAAVRSFHSLVGSTRLVFCFPSEAEIVEVATEDMVEVILEHMGYRIVGILNITLPPPDHIHCHWCYNPNCPCNGWCEEGCSCHGSSTNEYYCVGDPDWFNP